MLFVLGISLFQIRADRVQIGGCFCHSDSCVHVSYDHEHPTACAIIEVSRPVHLLMVHHRHKEGRRDEHYSPAKLWRRYAKDSKRMLVQLNRTAHYATITVFEQREARQVPLG